jgi:hypothetical protein
MLFQSSSAYFLRILKKAESVHLPLKCEVFVYSCTWIEYQDFIDFLCYFYTNLKVLINDHQLLFQSPALSLSMSKSAYFSYPQI